MRYFLARNLNGWGSVPQSICEIKIHDNFFCVLYQVGPNLAAFKKNWLTDSLTASKNVFVHKISPKGWYHDICCKVFKPIYGGVIFCNTSELFTSDPNKVLTFEWQIISQDLWMNYKGTSLIFSMFCIIKDFVDFAEMVSLTWTSTIKSTYPL